MADVIKDKYKQLFLEHEQNEQEDNKSFIPVEGTVQEIPEQDIGWAGHISYSPDLDELVYETRRTENLILQKVQGKGVSIDYKIIEELRNNCVKYVYVGKKETNSVFVFKLDSFDTEPPKEYTRQYNRQLYASLRDDMIKEIYGKMDEILTRPPFESDNSITIDEVRNRRTSETS
jgi:hypothetical protein